jgi:hypothetical protein
MMAVDLYSGLKGQRPRPSSVTISPVWLLTRVKSAVFWRGRRERDLRKYRAVIYTDHRILASVFNCTMAQMMGRETLVGRSWSLWGGSNQGCLETWLSHCVVTMQKGLVTTQCYRDTLDKQYLYLSKCYYMIPFRNDLVMGKMRRAA